MTSIIHVPLALVHRRWAIPILGLLHTQGARYAVMRAQLGISRDTLTTTLRHLIDQGLVSRNTAPGHPLRPEYLATAKGLALAAPCEQINNCLDGLGIRDVGLRKWSLPIVGIINQKPKTFSQIRRYLPTITPRALSKGVGDLRSIEMLNSASDGVYSLARVGQTLVPPLRYLEQRFTGECR